MNFDSLWEIYEQRSAYGGVPLRDFIQEVLDDKHGPVDGALLIELLEQLQGAVFENIDLMANSNPEFSEGVDEAKEAQSATFRALIGLVKAKKVP